ncbi:hypothetical protein BKA61DRAFT_575142 [Leptodontidium sp. MPI-SDFR-AT-0119]|nr:hypothetical protein BKA61DRAFT_575142 [Leptodontidium sp. MPI-SDFR-AT-0119]
MADKNLHEKTRMDLTASGSLPSVAEVGEVLGWLGAILRTSGAEGVIAYSVPRTEKLTTAALTFNLIFDISSLQQIHDTKISKGTCWHALFNYPVIAKEYPIPKRADEKGLEIPLNYMARLGQAYRSTIFSSRFVLKGCITMFIPAQRLDNSVLWHFLINQDKSRMSYLKVEELGLNKILSAISWDGLHMLKSKSASDQCENLGKFGKPSAGSAKELYRNIMRAHAEKISSGIAIGGLSVTAGKLVNVGIALKKGTRDSPIMLQRFCSILLVASLLPKVTTPISISTPSLNMQPRIQGLGQRWRPSKKRSNKELEIFEDVEYSRTAELDPSQTDQISRREVKSKLWCFQEAALEVYDAMEQMYDHQTKMRTSQDVTVHLPRRKLEGYEVMEIFRGLNAVPRVVQLQNFGSGWVKCFRQIGALTLFGNGFGNLIAPGEGSSILCN